MSELGGGVDILFNNAGLALGRYPFTESTLEDEQTVLHTNVDGVLRMTRLTLPHIRDGGHILFMGSVAGRQAYQNAASYVASKFGLRGFVYALREDLLGRPIRITTVDAGLVETEFSLVRYRWDEEAAKAVYEGVDPVTPGRDRGLRDVRAHAPAARERRRDRREGARAVERRPSGPPGELSRVLTILEGSTFCLSDDLGDMSGETSGFFAWDTRFLSRLVLRVDGARPLPLSAGRLQHFAAAFYLRNPPLDGLPGDSLSIARRRFVGTGLQERIAVRNESMDRLEFELSLELGADFADIISVKQHDFALGDPEHAPPLPPQAQPTQEGANGANGTLLFAEADGDARTRILLSKPAQLRERARRVPARARAARDLGAPARRPAVARRAARRRRCRRWTGSTTRSRRSATSSRPGRCASRSCAAAGRPCAGRSTSPSPTSRRSGSGPARSGDRSSRPGCRGS